MIRKQTSRLFLILNPFYWIERASRLPFILRGLIFWFLGLGVAIRSFPKPNLSPVAEMFGNISCGIVGIILLLVGMSMILQGLDALKKKPQ